MANPIAPPTLPAWCTIPVQETITFTNPVTGEVQTTKQLNIAQPSDIITQSGFVQESAVVEQDLNWLFNTIYNWIVYLNASVNTPPTYTQEALPAPSARPGLLVFVSDLGGGTLAVSNGTDWIKLTMNGTI